MLDILFAGLGLVLGIVVLGGVFWFATVPRSSRRSWLAPPSGDIDDPGKHWPGGSSSDL